MDNLKITKHVEQRYRERFSVQSQSSSQDLRIRVKRSKPILFERERTYYRDEECVFVVRNQHVVTVLTYNNQQFRDNS